MILQLIVTPKSFYSSSTDLTVRGWVYNMEDCVRVYKGHQHSVSMMMLENNTRKFSSDLTTLTPQPGYQARLPLTACHLVTWLGPT